MAGSHGGCPLTSTRRTVVFGATIPDSARLGGAPLTSWAGGAGSTAGCLGGSRPWPFRDGGIGERASDADSVDRPVRPGLGWNRGVGICLALAGSAGRAC